MLRFSNFPKKDHALASYSAIFLFVGTVLTQLIPQLHIDGLVLDAQQANIIALVASACAIIGGAIKNVPALTWGASISLAYQLITLLIESKIGEGSSTQKWLLVASAMLAVMAKFTAAESDPTPYGTGAKATGSTGGSAPTVIASDSPHAPQK